MSTTKRKRAGSVIISPKIALKLPGERSKALVPSGKIRVATKGQKFATLTEKDFNNLLGKGKWPVYLDFHEDHFELSNDDFLRGAKDIIKEIDFSNNSLERLNFIHTLTKLRRLNLQGNQLTDIRFSTLQSLEYLSLALNKFESVPDVGSLKSLVNLDLSGNTIDRGFGELQNLKALRVLDLGRNNIDLSLSQVYHSILVYLKRLPKLEYLGFEENPFTWGDDKYRLFVIAELPRLKYLDWREVTKEEREEAGKLESTWTGIKNVLSSTDSNSPAMPSKVKFNHANASNTSLPQPSIAPPGLVDTERSSSTSSPGLVKGKEPVVKGKAPATDRKSVALSSLDDILGELAEDSEKYTEKQFQSPARGLKSSASSSSIQSAVTNGAASAPAAKVGHDHFDDILSLIDSDELGEDSKPATNKPTPVAAPAPVAQMETSGENDKMKEFDEIFDMLNDDFLTEPSGKTSAPERQSADAAETAEKDDPLKSFDDILGMLDDVPMDRPASPDRSTNAASAPPQKPSSQGADVAQQTTPLASSSGRGVDPLAEFDEIFDMLDDTPTATKEPSSNNIKTSRPPSQATASTKNEPNDPLKDFDDIFDMLNDVNDAEHSAAKEKEKPAESKKVDARPEGASDQIDNVLFGILGDLIDSKYENQSIRIRQEDIEKGRSQMLQDEATQAGATAAAAAAAAGRGRGAVPRGRAGVTSVRGRGGERVASGDRGRGARGMRGVRGGVVRGQRGGSMRGVRGGGVGVSSRAGSTSSSADALAELDALLANEGKKSRDPGPMDKQDTIASMLDDVMISNYANKRRSNMLVAAEKNESTDGEELDLDKELALLTAAMDDTLAKRSSEKANEAQKLAAEMKAKREADERRRQEEERQWREEQEARRLAEEDARQKAEQEQKRREQEMLAREEELKRREEELRRMEEEALRQLEEEERRRQEEEVRRREEEERRRREEEELRSKQEEEEARKMAEEARARLAAEKKRQEEERQRQVEEEQQRLREEIERKDAARKRALEELARRREEAEQRRKEEEERRRAEEARRIAEEERRKQEERERIEKELAVARAAAKAMQELERERIEKEELRRAQDEAERQMWLQKIAAKTSGGVSSYSSVPDATDLLERYTDPAVPSYGNLPEADDFGLTKDTINEMRATPSWDIRASEFTMSDRLGTGTFGSVYKGLYKNREVAVKKMNCQRFDSNFLVQVKQDMALFVSLEHPNIVQTLGLCTEGTISCLTEFIHGVPLYGFLRSPAASTLSTESCIEICRGIANGLLYLHQNDIVHRSLKSKNVMMTDDNTPKLRDFAFHPIKDQVAASGAISAPHYSAPEALAQIGQAAGSAPPLGPEGDVYSFGCVVWEVFTHELPMGDMMPRQVVKSILVGERPPLVPEIPVVYQRMITACWQPAGSQRPTMDKVARIASTPIETIMRYEPTNALPAPTQRVSAPASTSSTYMPSPSSGISSSSSPLRSQQPSSSIRSAASFTPVGRSQAVFKSESGNFSDAETQRVHQVLLRLLDLLTSPYAQSQVKALKALANLAPNLSNAEAVRESKVIPVSVRLYQDGVQEVVEALLAAIYAVCSRPELCLQAMEAGAMGMAVSCTQNSNDVITLNAAKVITKMGEQGDSYRMELRRCGAVPALIKLLESFSEYSRLQALWALSVLFEDAQSQEQFMTERGLKLVLRLVHSNNPGIVLRCMILISMLSVNTELSSESALEVSRVMTELTIVERFVSFLKSKTPLLFQEGSKAIARLSAAKQYRSTVCTAGGIPALCFTLTQKDHVSTIDALDALTHLASEEKYRKQIRSAGSVNILLALVQDVTPDEEEVRKSSKLLSLLLNDGDAADQLHASGGVPLLLGNLTHSSATVRASALNVLSSAAESSGTVASAVNTASTPQTFAALLDMSREDVQLDAARLLGRLAASENFEKEFYGIDILARLCELLESENKDVGLACTKALANISAFASDNVARSLVGSAHVPQFLCYFLGPDYDSLVALVKGLARLCLEVPFANAALSSGIPGVLKEILLMKDPVLCSQCFRATLTLAKTAESKLTLLDGGVGDAVKEIIGDEHIDHRLQAAAQKVNAVLHAA